MYKNNEFEYDLWKDQEGHCFARIKGSELFCEISAETMKFLRREEKRLQRDKELKKLLMTTCDDNNGLSDERNRAAILYPISLSENRGEIDNRESAWLKCVESVEEDVIRRDFLKRLFEQLSPKQKDVFLNVMLGGETQQEYASKCGTTQRAVRNTIEKIIKKAKKIV